jgi:predicted lipoprotein
MTAGVNTKRAGRRLRVGLAIAIVAGLLAILRPWTIVPIQTTTGRTFDAREYAASVWDSRVLPTAESSAVDLQAFMQGQEGSAAGGGHPARAVFVKGTATVAEVDRHSRIGLARLRLPWARDGQAAAIQIGPVLRGTALRDALEFIRFTDFVNQLEFAGVANALNDRVMTNVLGAVNVDELTSHQVAFVGAVSVAAGSTLEIVPVRLQMAGGAR